jgi:hypothetical protein
MYDVRTDAWVGGWLGAAVNEELISCDLMAIQVKCYNFSI